MDIGEGGYSGSGPNMGMISSMQHHSNSMGGGVNPEGQLSFGVEGNILQSITGEDPKGGSLISIMTGGLNSMSGIDFTFGLFAATQPVSSAFGLPTGPNVGLPNLNFGLKKSQGQGR